MNRLRAIPERDTARGQPLNSAAPAHQPRLDPRVPPEPPPPMIPPLEVRRASISMPKKRKKREKKFGVRRFSFSRIKSAIFLITIPDPIFVVV